MTATMQLTQADQEWISEHFPRLSSKLEERIASGEYEVIVKEMIKNDD